MTGRSSRFRPGWFVLPGALLGTVGWALLLQWIAGLFG